LNLSRLLLRLCLGRRLPRTRGALTVPGLSTVLRVHRDRWGVPYVEAETDADAWFGLGFCHGQDRAFQLEVLRRVGRGTLSELLGAVTLPVDRLCRRIGFHRAAAGQWPTLPPDVREMLSAYARGVTAGADVGLPRRPHEFVLLGGRPGPWTPEDSLALLKLVSFTLPSNWDAELARLMILTLDGTQALTDLDPTYRTDHPVVTPPGKMSGPSLDRLGEELRLLGDLVGRGGGSNNWVVAGSRTAAGRPILANDPHLNAGLPAHWYLAHLRTPHWAAAGATFVGGPGVFVGHNGTCAWGLTAGLIDNTDLFQEQISPDGQSVRAGDGWQPCRVVDEVIAVKKGPAVTERVLLTPRGPLLASAEGGVPALSLRATWLDALPLRGLLAAHKCRSFDELRAAVADWPASSQNVVYADVRGVIGWQLAGRAPRRRCGYGLLPLPGWESPVGWEADAVPFTEMPHVRDPADGFVATANSKPLPDDIGPWLGGDWVDGYRLAAIRRALAARSDWTVADTMRLQTDQDSLPWQEMREAVLAVPPEGHPDAAFALDLLRDWDGVVSADSRAAMVFELFVVEMTKRVVRAKAPKSAEWALGRSAGALNPYNFFAFRRVGHLARLLREQPDGWFAGSWHEETRAALVDVVLGISASRERERPEAHPSGRSRSRLAWGDNRPLVLHHPLGRVRWLSRVFNLGPIPCGGDTDTINQAAVLPLAPLAPADNIASLRVVIDVGEWSNSRFVLPGGQSGNPLSPHYEDQWPLWQRGDGIPIAWTPDEVRRATRETLTLASRERERPEPFPSGR